MRIYFLQLLVVVIIIIELTNFTTRTKFRDVSPIIRKLILIDLAIIFYIISELFS